MMTNYTSVPRYQNYFSRNTQRASYNTEKFWGRRSDTKCFKDLRFGIWVSLSCNSWHITSINFTFSGPCVVIYLLSKMKFSFLIYFNNLSSTCFAYSNYSSSGCSYCICSLWYLWCWIY